MTTTPLDTQLLATFLKMALSAVERRYPFQWPMVLTEAPGTDALPALLPDALFPAFHTSYDWHSCVHGHWCLVRLVRLAPKLPDADRARRHLVERLTPERLSGELATLQRPGFANFERPYGLGWVCKLAAELRLWRNTPADVPVADMTAGLAPLAELATARMLAWHKRLPYPVHSGEHSQSAFGLGLVRDWAVTSGDQSTVAAIDAEIRRLYATTARVPLFAEPSGHDFLSPSLARLELVGRVLDPRAFSRWLTQVLPELDAATAATAGAPPWLPPAQGHVANDGKLAHLIGLNLSRAWMLRRIAKHLQTDPRVALLEQTADAHSRAGRAAIVAEHFESSHWLASFAVYDLSE